MIAKAYNHYATLNAQPVFAVLALRRQRQAGKHNDSAVVSGARAELTEQSLIAQARESSE